jgi:aspartate kinase
MEGVVDSFMAGRREEAVSRFAAVEGYHNAIIGELFEGAEIPSPVQQLYGEVREMIAGEAAPKQDDFERWYDAIVSYGELLSTTIIAEYLASTGKAPRWVDMRRCIVTDDRFKYANVDMEATTRRLREVTAEGELFIGQGFIGGTAHGETTTLGREGSDYSAAVVAWALDAESVAIWKDVPGVLSADPKIFTEAAFIPELTWLDAIELAFSGAQIIHPKTIKPLQNKNIPLYVRPFGDKNARGSVIKAEVATPVEMPVLILKRDQVLVSIRPHDYSFVLEEKLGDIFRALEKYNVKVNLVQTSAVNMSISIDRTRHMEELMDELRAGGFYVKYNEGMELLTIRGFTEEELDRYDRTSDDIYLSQRTRRVLRLVRPATGAGK